MQRTVNRTSSQKRQISTQYNFRRQNKNQGRSQKSFQSPPRSQSSLKSQVSVTATNWCMYDQHANRFVGQREDHQRQVASLTKIMTVVVCLQLFQRYSLDKDIFIRVSYSAAAHNGTSAQLKSNKYLKLWDIFYGAMLPSGNDAAFLLAQVFGLLLFYQSLKPQNKDYSEIQSIDLTCYDSTLTFTSRFLKEMNRKSKQLKMTKTAFHNPHGLGNILNVSSARDMLTLSRYACSNKEFREVMSKEQHSAQFFQDDLVTVNCVRLWTNTNKLLGMGWDGIKTGMTPSAGSCLASVKDGLFIVVLNSANREARFDDTITLWEWYQCNQWTKE